MLLTVIGDPLLAKTLGWEIVRWVGLILIVGGSVYAFLTEEEMRP